MKSIIEKYGLNSFRLINFCLSNYFGFIILCIDKSLIIFIPVNVH